MGSTIVLLVFLVFVLILVGIPIYASLGLAGVISLLTLAGGFGGNVAWLVVPQSIYNGIGYSPLLAIPFYIFAGEIMNRGQITERLINFSLLLIGRMPASLAQANIVASMFFGGITGSAQADTSAIGGILIPAMVRDGYSPETAVGVTASSSTCGPIIPPSIMMVVFAIAVNASIGALFMGGIIPGLMIGFSLMSVVAILNKRHNYPKRTVSYSREEKIDIILKGLPPLGMPLIIVGGIMMGVVTATEAGALAVIYSLIVSMVFLKTVRVRDLFPMMLHTVTLSAVVLMIISCAKIFAYGLTALQMSRILSELILSITTNKYVFLLLVNVLLLIMGMFMDGSAAVIILAPIFTPIAVTMGISVIHFGIIMVLNLVIGAGTPPVGACLFIACKIADISVERGSRGILPYVTAEIVVLFLVTYVPFLVTFIPTLLGYTV
jgi:tripartite ATP-independent transporter DctM subunit